jgi:hypothetical protein
MTLSRKLMVGGFAAGIIALSGAASAFAAPSMMALPRSERARTRIDRTLVAAPPHRRVYGSVYGDTMDRDGGPSGKLGDGNPYDQRPADRW